MHNFLFALIPLALTAPPMAVHFGRQARSRRRCRQMMKAHRDGYQRFLVEHAKG